MDSCMAYISSQEALADYVTVISYLRRERGGEKSRFVAFGGSYGGMLSAWLRMLFPSAVDGALAASAPILGFPPDSCPLDSSARAVTGAASPSPGQSSKGCADNLKASYVLIHDIGKTSEGIFARTSPFPFSSSWSKRSNTINRSTMAEHSTPVM